MISFDGKTFGASRVVKNKAGYMATPIASRTADGQGPYLRSHDHLGWSNESKNRKNPQKIK